MTLLILLVQYSTGWHRSTRGLLSVSKSIRLLVKVQLYSFTYLCPDLPPASAPEPPFLSVTFPLSMILRYGIWRLPRGLH